MPGKHRYSYLPPGVAKTPKGDLGANRSKEAKALGTFKHAEDMNTAKYFSSAEPRTMTDRPYQRYAGRDDQGGDRISPESLSGTGRPRVNVDVGSGLAPKKASPFKSYAENTKPPQGRALPVRGEGPSGGTGLSE